MKHVVSRVWKCDLGKKVARDPPSLPTSESKASEPQVESATPACMAATWLWDSGSVSLGVCVSHGVWNPGCGAPGRDATQMGVGPFRGSGEVRLPWKDPEAEWKFPLLRGGRAPEGGFRSSVAGRALLFGADFDTVLRD